jgi:hypothetical protein
LELFLLFFLWIFPVYVSAKHVISKCKSDPRYFVSNERAGHIIRENVPLALGIICLIGLGISQYEAWQKLRPLYDLTAHDPHKYGLIWPIPETALLVLSTLEAIILFISFQVWPPHFRQGALEFILRNTTIIILVFIFWRHWYYHWDIGSLPFDKDKGFQQEDNPVISATLIVIIGYTIVRWLVSDVVLRLQEQENTNTVVLLLTTAIIITVFCVDPLLITAWFEKALLIPVILGIWVPTFSYFAMRATTSGWPIITLLLLVILFQTALNNSHTVEVYNNRPMDQWVLGEALEKWRKVNCLSKDCPEMILVGAQGGASRSAFFTGSVLGKTMDSGQDGIQYQQIFAMSGVSGGSVGLAFFSASLADTEGKSPPCRKWETLKAEYNGILSFNYSGFVNWFYSRETDPNGKAAYEKRLNEYHMRWQDCLEVLTAGDFLSPVVLKMIGRDFLGLNWLLGRDRAASLEDSWERHYRRISGTKRLKRSFLSVAPSKDGDVWRPLLLFNGTSVETGRRVITSHLRPWYCKEGKVKRLFTDAYDLHELLSLTQEEHKIEECTCEGERMTCPQHTAQKDVKLSTAASISARFPVITPQADLDINREDRPVARIVDGGYFENYGATTLYDLVRALQDIDPALKVRVVLLTSDPSLDPMDCIDQDAMAVPNSPGGEARQWWSLYRSIFTAVDEARKARGASAAIALCRRLQEYNYRFTHIAVKEGLELRDSHEDEPKVEQIDQKKDDKKKREKIEDLSMSWWLSYPVQRYLHDSVKPIYNKGGV